MYRSRCKNYLPSFYNFEDLIASKSNLKKLDARLKRTLNSKLKNINQHEVLIFEPHFYIVEKIFPQAKMAKILYDRIDELNPNSYINGLSQIIIHGSSVSQGIKNAITQHATNSKQLKAKNNRDALNFAKKVFQSIGYKSKSEVDYIDFIPYVEDLLIGQLNIYRQKYMLHTSQIDRTNFDPNDYELFVKTFSRYLSTLVGIEGENPALNDNIDSLILLYVDKKRKFMGCETKWLKLIKDIGLHKKYIEPYAKSIWKSWWYKIQLLIIGKIEFSDCKN